MKTVKEIVKGNIKDYEDLVRLLYEVGELTKVDMEPVIAELDDIYDFNDKLKVKEG